MNYGVVNMPIWVSVLFAIGFIGFCIGSWAINKHLGGDVR